MNLNRSRLGKYLSLVDERNTDGRLAEKDVRGISTDKRFIETKADLTGVSLSNYKIVKPGYFAYVADTSRRGDKVSLAYNDGESEYLVSSITTVFRVSKPDIVNPIYLFMYYSRPEFDRYARFNSWGSAREAFSWEDMCDIDIELPPIQTQQEFVAVYRALLANQHSYERGLEDLKLVCDGFIEKLRHTLPKKRIGEHIKLCEEKNDLLIYGIDDVRGISTEKKFIETKADMKGVSLTNYKLVPPGRFAYVADTSRRGDKISLAQNDSDATFLVSSISIVFETEETILAPEYLMLFFSRPEFDRYARFNSWGSAREAFSWEDMCDVCIPIPDICVQRSIADVFAVYNERKRINERLKAQLKEICPLLIKGSLVETIA